jgi:hypothetical protein
MDGEWGSVCWGYRDNGINGRRRWWTRGVALVRLWDSRCGSTRNKWKKGYGRLYCVKGADYGRGGGPKAGLCKLNRQECRDGFRSGQRRWGARRDSETDWNSTWCDTIQSIQCFCSYKVHDFILLFRCHPGMDFDIRQREVPFSGILSFRLSLLPPPPPSWSVSIRLSVTDCGNGTIR